MTSSVCIPRRCSNEYRIDRRIAALGGAGIGDSPQSISPKTTDYSIGSGWILRYSLLEELTRTTSFGSIARSTLVFRLRPASHFPQLRSYSLAIVGSYVHRQRRYAHADEPARSEASDHTTDQRQHSRLEPMDSFPKSLSASRANSFPFSRPSRAHPQAWHGRESIEA